MEGAVNHLFRSLEAIWSDAMNWPKKFHIVPANYHSKCFEGNQCRDLLRTCDYLRSNEVPIQALIFANVFKSLRDVVKSCFGALREDDYQDKISVFTDDYRKTALPFTPKIHVICFHIHDFFAQFDEKDSNNQQLGLGYFSEQAAESLHYGFENIWKRYKIKEKKNEKYIVSLKNAVTFFSSNNL